MNFQPGLSRHRAETSFGSTFRGVVKEPSQGRSGRMSRHPVELLADPTRPKRGHPLPSSGTTGFGHYRMREASPPAPANDHSL